MNLPFGVLAVYAALLVWAVLGLDALRRGVFARFNAWGLGLLLFLNLRYFVEGVPASIAFFIGIYDVLDNLGLGAEGAAAMVACPGNDCSVWGDRFGYHPEWGVAFYERFLNGPAFRSNLLYGHIGFNTVAFLLVHVQLAKPGSDPASRRWHRWLGRASFGAVTLGVACACALASEHGPVDAYGGRLSEFGFYFMSLVVYACALMGVVAVRRGDLAGHRVWMIRFAGSMWGSFWLFRVLLFFIDPLFRDVRSLAILVCIWGSAPAGVLMAEIWRRAYDGESYAPPAGLPQPS